MLSVRIGCYTFPRLGQMSRGLLNAYSLGLNMEKVGYFWPVEIKSVASTLLIKDINFYPYFFVG